MFRTAHSFVSLLVVVPLLMSSGGPSIGLVRANGSFRLDNAQVTGNATVFDGSVLETGGVSSQVRLRNGASLAVVPGSRTRVYLDRAVLAGGEAELAGPYRIDAGTLSVVPAAADARAQVRLSQDRVQVAALSGSVRVLNAAGATVAAVLPGAPLEFHPATEAATEFYITGKLVLERGRYFLTDETTGVKTEIAGNNLRMFVGKRTTVRGSLVRAAQGDAGVPVVNATLVGFAPGAAAGTGHAFVATASIIGGVAVGGTVIGLAAAGKLPWQTPKSR